MTDDDSDRPDSTPKDIPESDPHLVAQVRGAMQRLSGRVYRVQLERLDHNSLRALLAFIRDVESNHSAALRRSRMTPWIR